MKPTLFVLAAGMGSRYGGLKQLDPLGPNGETIMDYSVYDALKAGFGKIVFVIRKDFEDDFRNKVLSRYEGHIPVEVVFQATDKLPEGYTCPAYCMVGFRVGNTMTENGSVSRGVCTVKDGNLDTIVERTAITYDKDHNIVFTDENGIVQRLEANTPVSMNLWGFTPDYFDYSEREFRTFLDNSIDTPKSEFYIPSCVDTLVKNGEATVKVLDTDSRWFGVTYAEDRPGVVAKFAELHADGTYPEKLF